MTLAEKAKARSQILSFLHSSLLTAISSLTVHSALLACSVQAVMKETGRYEWQ